MNSIRVLPEFPDRPSAIGYRGSWALYRLLNAGHMSRSGDTLSVRYVLGDIFHSDPAVVDRAAEDIWAVGSGGFELDHPVLRDPRAADLARRLFDAVDRSTTSRVMMPASALLYSHAWGEVERQLRTPRTLSWAPAAPAVGVTPGCVRLISASCWMRGKRAAGSRLASGSLATLGMTGGSFPSRMA